MIDCSVRAVSFADVVRLICVRGPFFEVEMNLVVTPKSRAISLIMLFSELRRRGIGQHTIEKELRARVRVTS
jgi:hypothetical protein